GRGSGRGSVGAPGTTGCAARPRGCPRPVGARCIRPGAVRSPAVRSPAVRSSAVGSPCAGWGAVSGRTVVLLRCAARGGIGGTVPALPLRSPRGPLPTGPRGAALDAGDAAVPGPPGRQGFPLGRGAPRVCALAAAGSARRDRFREDRSGVIGHVVVGVVAWHGHIFAARRFPGDRRVAGGPGHRACATAGALTPR